MSLRPLAALLAAAALAACSSSSSSTTTPAVEHVLLVSVDGLHQLDLNGYVAAHPTSALASLAATGVTYKNARCPTPSDSFPGILALVTGGSPKTTGVYYDDSYDRTMFPPGSDCSGSPGTEVLYDESVDVDLGQLLSGGLDASRLPRALVNGACEPVYPHQFVKVNTLFEVVRAAGGVTAWSDKHYAYDLVNGPSGQGVMDLYTPEINSDVVNGGTVNGVDLAGSKAACDATNSLGAAKVTDYTTCLPTVEAYDDVKVRALLNQIDGKNSDGLFPQAVPTVFGMNFQAVSVGQKLTPCGYADAAGTPTACLADALAHTDASLGKLVAELKSKGLLETTLIVITAKHGQSPVDRSKVAMEIATLGNVTDPAGLVSAGDPAYSEGSQAGGHLMADDVGIVWLQSPTSVAAVVTQLESNAAAIHADALPAGTVFTQSITAGAALAALFGDPAGADPVAQARAPSVFIQPNAGVIYSGSSKKRAEHGGGTPDDTAVALLISRPAIAKATITDAVKTTQVAPTILKQLGLDPARLQAVVKEGTAALPGL